MSSFVSREEILYRMSAEAPDHYTYLPYHNFDEHIVEAKEDFSILVEELKAEGIEIDLESGEAVIDWHDADYSDDHIFLGFSSKEALSLCRAERRLRAYGADETLVSIFRGGINATHPMGRPQTNLELAIRISDVGNLAKDFPVGLRKGLLIAREQKILNNPLPSDYATYCSNSQKFLGLYVDEPLPFYRPDGSEYIHWPFYINAQNNVQQLGSMTIKNVLEIVDDAEQLILPEWL